MKTVPLCAALLSAIVFFACQKEISNPEMAGSTGTGTSHRATLDPNLLCRYENYYYYVVNGCYTYLGTMSIQLEEQDKDIAFTISNYDHEFTLKATPVSSDSAVIKSQKALDKRTGKTDAYEGILRVQNGVLSIRLSAPNPYVYSYYRSDPMPGPIQRNDYVGAYTARFLYNNQMATHTMRILPGAAPDELVLENVQGYGLTVAARVSNGKIYTQTTAMNAGGDSLRATTAEIQGNVLSLYFVKQGPNYSPSSPSSSGAVICYKQ